MWPGIQSSLYICSTWVITKYWHMQLREKLSQMWCFYVHSGASYTSRAGQLVKLKVMAVVFLLSALIESIKQHCACTYVSGGCQMMLLRQFKCKNKAKHICGGGPCSIKLPLCLPFSIKSPNPPHEWRGFAAHTSEEKQPKYQRGGIALFISPSLFLFSPLSPRFY